MIEWKVLNVRRWINLLKENRQEKIVEMIEQNGSVKVNEIMELLNVSKMTVRRDLAELEEMDKIKRIHGGAKKIKEKRVELSHSEKQIIHLEEKKEIVETALGYIQEGDTIFLGAGTTIEMLAKKIEVKNIRVITCSLPVFTYLVNQPDIKVYLIGGEMRPKTQAFHGELATRLLEDMHFSKTFISCNGFDTENMMTATLEEAKIHQIALDNAGERYLLIDSSKFQQEDFYTFYSLERIDKIIMDYNESVWKKLAENNHIVI